MTHQVVTTTIGISPSTITRELKCNRGSHGKYNWTTAQANATYRKQRQLDNHAVKGEVKAEGYHCLLQDSGLPSKYPVAWR